MSVAKGTILGMGNPLLDISTTVDAAYLEKYELKANDAILAEDKHMPIYAEIQKDHKPDFIAGGATQNSIRVAQWMLKDSATAYMGSVGNDETAKLLQQKAEEGGTQVAYHVDESTPTGTCAVLITDNNRCLVTSLGAANNYKEEHLDKVGWPIVEAAKIYYISGFFLTVSPSSINRVGKHAAETGKIFTMNLAAPFISMVPPFRAALCEALNYVDILFGNETEYAEFAKQMEWGTDLSLDTITQKIAALPKANGARGRIAVCTQGPDETIICENGVVSKYPIRKVENIVDTNGAGDAWVGGFLAALAKGKSTKECTEAASYAASVIIQRSGCTYPDSPEYEL